MVTEKTGKKWIKPGNGQPLLVSCYCGDLGLSGHCSRPPWHSGYKASCKSSCVWWRKWRVCSGVQEVWSIIARDGPTRKRTWEDMRLAWWGEKGLNTQKQKVLFLVLVTFLSTLHLLLVLGHKGTRAAELFKHLFTSFPYSTLLQKTTVGCLWHWLIIFPVLTMNPGYCAGWESIPSLNHSPLPSPRVILMDAVKSYVHYLSKYGTFIGCCKC